MRTVKNLFIGIARSGVWPIYLAAGAYAARQAPWPASVSAPVEALVWALAFAAFANSFFRWLFRRGGCAEDVLGMPTSVAYQLRFTVLLIVVGSLILLLPSRMIARGLIAPEGRAIAAPAVVRVLTLGYELYVLGVAVWLFRTRSALVVWLAESPKQLGRLARHPRVSSLVVVAGVAGVMLLDVRGYSYSANRLATGALGSLLIAMICWAIYRILIRLIDERAWRWIKVGQALAGLESNPDASVLPDDLATRLRRLSGYLVIGIGVLVAAGVWDIDLAFFRYLGKLNVWEAANSTVDDPGNVKVGDIFRAGVIIAICIAAWRHMSTFFALVVFPRIPDDPGVRFALVTLCRYTVLGIGIISSLSAIHLGLDRIGVVLAALGVGLGFGLQEVVSNFVCGIILLLERPIRVGDIVTVSGMTGKVDRINIRATTIINGDNQSMVIPNRAFITGDLVNWTLKDKVIRVTIRVKSAFGTDPDRVTSLLLEVARDDADVLHNPAPDALMEEISNSAFIFVLYVYVPEPGLAGRVRHRLFRQIQKRFEDAGIPLPLPVQELRVSPSEIVESRTIPAPKETIRVDTPAPHVTTARPIPAPVEECHRGVDE